MLCPHAYPLQFNFSGKASLGPILGPKVGPEPPVQRQKDPSSEQNGLTSQKGRGRSTYCSLAPSPAGRGTAEHRLGGGVEWTRDTKISFPSPVCAEGLQEVRGAGSWGARGRPPWSFGAKGLGGATPEPGRALQLRLGASCLQDGEGVSDLRHFHGTQVPKDFVVPVRRTAPAGRSRQA